MMASYIRRFTKPNSATRLAPGWRRAVRQGPFGFSVSPGTIWRQKPNILGFGWRQSFPNIRYTDAISRQNTSYATYLHSFAYLHRLAPPGDATNAPPDPQIGSQNRLIFRQKCSKYSIFSAKSQLRARSARSPARASNPSWRSLLHLPWAPIYVGVENYVGMLRRRRPFPL